MSFYAIRVEKHQQHNFGSSNLHVITETTEKTVQLNEQFLGAVRSGEEVHH